MLAGSLPPFCKRGQRNATQVDGATEKKKTHTGTRQACPRVFFFNAAKHPTPPAPSLPFSPLPSSLRVLFLPFFLSFFPPSFCSVGVFHFVPGSSPSPARPLAAKEHTDARFLTGQVTILELVGAFVGATFAAWSRKEVGGARRGEGGFLRSALGERFFWPS